MEVNDNHPQSFSPQEATRALYKNWRERFIVPMLVGALIFGGGALIPAIISANNAFLNGLLISVYGIVGVVAFINFPYPVRAWAFLIASYAIGIVELYRYNILGDSGVFFFAMIVAATMMLSPKEGVINAGIVVFTHIIFGYLFLNGHIQSINDTIGNPILMDWASEVIVIVMYSSVIIYGFWRLEGEFTQAQSEIETTLGKLNQERDSMEDKVLERTMRLRKLNEIGRVITSTLDPDEAISRAARLIGDEYECYFTAIYLLDPTGQWANLVEATSESGRVMRENRFRVDTRGKHPAAVCIRQRQAQILLSSDNSPLPSENPLLPHTRSQICIPMSVGEQVIGVLEMHAKQENAFNAQENDVYQNIANEIAVAYENAALYRESQQTLTELRATQRQYLRGAWMSLAAENNLEYEVGETMLGDAQTSVPLLLRDQIIGQLEMATREPLPPEQKNLIESIATQAALALENARLVEESQSIAARERLTNEITSKVWASTTMESILQTTVRELGRALEVAEAEIHISMDNEDE